jgi:hypothetical protein
MDAMRIAVLSALLLVGSVSLAAEDARYGAGVTLESATPLADVIAKPAAFAGQTVRVEGVVTAVCEHMGCWMTLAPAGTPKGAPTLRLKVDDGVIVFPVSAKGKTAVAQGVVEALAGDDHHAAELGKNSYQLKVTGALVR